MRRRRSGYWVAWNVVTGTCLALGTVVTVLIDPPAALVLMAIMAAGAACLLTTVVKQADKAGGRFVLRTAPLLLLVLTGVNGLAAALGAATVALIALLVATGIPLAWQAKHGNGMPVAPAKPAKAGRKVKPAEPVAQVAMASTGPEPAAGESAESVMPLVVPEPSASTASLCWTWRTSFTALRKADGVDARLRIVELRQHCLDELARREPTGFRKWLEAGARAAGDPSRYVCVRREAPVGEERQDDDDHHG